MKIMFYQKRRINKNEIISENVHIAEVLNHLVGLGHTVLYANGETHSIINLTDGLQFIPLSSNSLWQKIKKYFSKSPLGGEALISYNFIKEIGLFLLAVKTIIKKKPDLIFRRNWIFASEHILSRIFKIPHVTEINGITVDEIEISKEGDKLSLWIINNIERYNFGKADKYIVVTSKLKDTLHTSYNIPDNKIIVIENGANTDLFKPMDVLMAKRALNLSSTNCYIGFVGGLIVWQGLNNFLSAMSLILKEFPDARALFVGEDYMKGKLQEQSKQLGISDKVIFTGRIPYGKVPLYINANDICISFPNNTERNRKTGASPLKLCEYLACGKPVVTSRINGLELVEQYNCGYLVNPGDSEEFSRAVIRLLRDPSTRQRMGENGRKFVIENRSWFSITKKVADVFQTVIKEYKR
jgi:glycosyltransferase involved in cell wall biosynthesis